jgi:hypothetical protein
MLTIKPASVIRLGIGPVYLMSQYVGQPCPVVACRAKSEDDADT